MKLNKNDRIIPLYWFYTFHTWLVCLVLFLLFFITLVPFFLIYSIFFDPDKQSFSYLAKLYVKSLFVFLVFRKKNFDFSGITAPGKNEKRIYVINHSSQADIVLMHLLPGISKIIIKEKWAKRPLIGWMQKLSGNIIIKDRSSSIDSRDMFAEAADKLNKGIPVIIFPEGTRSRDGKMGKFHKGSFRLALETGADIVPVIFDSWNSIRPGSSWVRDRQPSIKLMQPLRYESFKHLSHIKLAKYVRTMMLDQLIKTRDFRRDTDQSYYRNIAKFIETDNKLREDLEKSRQELADKKIALCC